MRLLYCLPLQLTRLETVYTKGEYPDFVILASQFSVTQGQGRRRSKILLSIYTLSITDLFRYLYCGFILVYQMLLYGSNLS